MNRNDYWMLWNELQSNNAVTCYHILKTLHKFTFMTPLRAIKRFRRYNFNSFLYQMPFRCLSDGSKKIPTFILEREENNCQLQRRIHQHEQRSALCLESLYARALGRKKERRMLDSGPHRKQNNNIIFRAAKKETFRKIHRHVNRESIRRSEKVDVVKKMSQMALTTLLLTSVKKRGKLVGWNLL